MIFERGVYVRWMRMSIAGSEENRRFLRQLIEKYGTGPFLVLDVREAQKVR